MARTTRREHTARTCDQCGRSHDVEWWARYDAAGELLRAERVTDTCPHCGGIF